VSGVSLTATAFKRLGAKSESKRHTKKHRARKSSKKDEYTPVQKAQNSNDYRREADRHRDDWTGIDGAKDAI
jgi:hypothetical protein